MAILEAAEAWGTPPWEIAGGGHPLLWLNRFLFYQGQITAKQNEDLEELNGRRT